MPSFVHQTSSEPPGPTLRKHPAPTSRKPPGPPKGLVPVNRAVADPVFQIQEDGHLADMALLLCGHLVRYQDLAADLATAPCHFCDQEVPPHIGEVACRQRKPGDRLLRALILARREIARAPIMILNPIMDAVC